MALRKIKDLIREMVFDNQSDVREYANVMANLVFDRNQADEYEKSLESAEKTAKDYDKKITEINAELDGAKLKTTEIVARKKELSVEEFKSAIAQAQQSVKEIETEQRTTIEEKIQNGFSKLEPVIKKYGCLRYLANEYVKNADFKTEIGADGFIYADEYEFKSSEMANNFREISDYVDYIFGNRESKITEPKSIVDIIRADAKELDLTIDKLTPANIVNIYNNLLARIAEENRNKQTENEQIEQSQIGIKPVRDFGDGLVMYRLLPDTEYYNEHGEHRNLVYESDQMGICIGQEQQSYSQKIFDLKKNQYYSLRSRNKNGQLIPHCTIEVNGDVVSQVKGKANGAVNGKYIKQVREFLKNDLNCAFPGEKPNERKLYDYSNIGFVRDIYGNTVDLFNLPPNTELTEISYDLLSVKGIDFKNIKSIDTLDCSGGTVTQKEFDRISSNILIKNFDFHRAKLSGAFNFSKVKKLKLSWCDLSDAEIKFNPNAECIDLSYAEGLHGTHVFSDMKNLNLNYADLSNAKIKINSGVKILHLYRCDLSNVEINNPYAEFINLSDSTNLHGTYDFSGVKILYLYNCDLSNVTQIIVNQQLFDDIIGSINESDRHKFVVAKPESKVDLLNKGITNLKNRLNIDTQQLTEKISASDREND